LKKYLTRMGDGERIEMTVDELKKEIEKARDLTKGIIGINIMFAASQFANLVKAAIEEGIDLVVSGQQWRGYPFKQGSGYSGSRKGLWWRYHGIRAY